MTTGGSVSAIDATAADVLHYLDGEFAEFARGVADARYTLWLGSGISLDRVEGLKAILHRALMTLHEAVDPDNDGCRFRAALHQILERSGLGPEKLAALDEAAGPADWPESELRDLLRGLAQNYSKVLDVRVAGEAADYLLWEVIDVRASYAQGEIEPDCEHFAIAMLSLEGHAPQILSANWDGLIEKAFGSLGHSSADILRVCVRADDLEGTTARSRLIKFHGCAIRASEDEGTYRPLLIHQAHQILNYHNNAEYRAIRTELVSQATTRPTLMIGLSAQDVDIQGVFSDAAAARTWPYPSVPPAYVFAENALGADQGTIIRSVYGPAFDTRAGEIESSSVLRAYAKALLTGLLLHVLSQKLQALAQRCEVPGLSQADLDSVCSDIRWLRDHVAEQRDLGPLELVRRIGHAVSNAMHIFRTGKAAELETSRYWPLTSTPLHAIETDAEIPVGGLPELAVCLGLVARGVLEGAWGVRTTGPEAALVLQAQATGSQARVLFAANSRAAVALEQSGLVDSSSDDCLVVHSDHVVPPLPRSPRAAPGRTGRSGPRHVGMVDLLTDVTSLAELRLRFREEAGL